MDAGATLLLAAAMVGAGAVSGLLAGLFGIGGGAVVVPVLYQALMFVGVEDAVRMHIAVATSVGVIVPTSIRSFLAHRKRGAVDMDLLKSWLVPIPLGAVAAAVVAAFISDAGLRALFAVVATLFGLRLILAEKIRPIGKDLPGPPIREGVGLGIGLVSTLMGIGGGVLNNTFMTLYGRSMHQAVATSAGVGVLISVPAVVGYIITGWGRGGLPAFSAGYVNLVALVLLMPVSVLAAPVGVRLAHALSRRQLEVGFGLFLLVIAARFALSLV